MKISEIMSKDVISTKSNEKISKVLVKMEEHRIHQLPIIDNGSYTGMVVLKDLLSTAYAPEKTEVKKFKVNVPTLNPDDTLEEVVIKFIGSGYRALPVIYDSTIGMVSSTDLIKHIKYRKEELLGHFLANVITVKDTASLGDALHLMNENNISSLPVVGREGKVISCFDSLSMIKFLKVPHESIRSSKITAIEKESLKGFPVKQYVRPTVTMEIIDFSIKKIVDCFQSCEEVVLTKNGKPVGIITPKDLLEHAMIEEMRPVEVSQYKKIDSMMQRRVETELDNFIDRFSKMFRIENFFIYIDSYKDKENGRKKYSIRARLITGHRSFPAHSHGWDIMDAVHILIDKLEKQLIKYHDFDVPQNLGKQIKITNDNCISCGVCASIYPDVFEIGEDGNSRVKEGVIVDKERLKEVMRSCPAQGIELKTKKDKS